MKRIGIVRALFLCVTLCMLFMGTTALAAETQTKGMTDNNLDGGCRTQWSVDLVDWQRRIYVVHTEILRVSNMESEAIKVYAGENYHLTDKEGKVLKEGDWIDASGKQIEDSNTVGGGNVCRDKNGWYVQWEMPDLTNWGKHDVYMQANTDFEGGNNQFLGVPGVSGIYRSKNDKNAFIEFDYSTYKMNVAAEVDVTDVHFPVLQGCDVESVDFLSKAVVKMEAVYGELKNIPIQVQWYRVTANGHGTEIEGPVGERMTSMPYYIPESELLKLTEARTYRVKVFYMGEKSTDEARQNTNGYENAVSDTQPMDEAIFAVELIKGHIDISVQLEEVPYNNRYASNTFSYQLYRFDEPNQIIQDNTPYTTYSVTFDVNDPQIIKHIHITDLSAGWYTLIPEPPSGDYAEKVEERSDNNASIPRTGGTAGMSFYIGDILENEYAWEIIRYQGQDTSNSIGDNFFKVSYSYRETVYGVNYELNLPEGVQSNAVTPVETVKYREGTKFDVKGGSGMIVDGWQFVGWSLEAGDGIYSSEDVLFSDVSINQIPVEPKAIMKEGGITFYAQWLPVYAVNYHSNTGNGGELPKDTGGTAKTGMNLYFSGDKVTVLPHGSLEKVDVDGTTYLFDGWSLNQDGSGERFKAGDQVTIESSDITFYAQWKAFGTDKYAVNYIVVVPEGAEFSGTAPYDDEKYADGNVVKVKGQETMVVNHYRFAGWALTSREDGLYQAGEALFGPNDISTVDTKEETVMKDQGLSFYSRWIPLYQVIYHSNADVTEGVPVDTNEYEAEEMVTILSGDEMIRPGYQFVGWNTEKDGSGQRYDVGLKFNMPKENIELYAEWEKVSETETDLPESEEAKDAEKDAVWPLVLLAILGTACITAYVVYQIMIHRKE